MGGKEEVGEYLGWEGIFVKMWCVVLGVCVCVCLVCVCLVCVCLVCVCVLSVCVCANSQVAYKE